MVKDQLLAWYTNRGISGEDEKFSIFEVSIIETTTISYFIVNNKTWNNLSSIFPKYIVKKFISVSIPMNDIEDKSMQEFTCEGKISAKTTT